MYARRREAGAHGGVLLPGLSRRRRVLHPEYRSASRCSARREAGTVCATTVCGNRAQGAARGPAGCAAAARVALPRDHAPSVLGADVAKYTRLLATSGARDVAVEDAGGYGGKVIAR